MRSRTARGTIDALIGLETLVNSVQKRGAGVAVRHGSLDRLPEVLGRGDVSSLDKLCESYTGLVSAMGRREERQISFQLKIHDPRDLFHAGLGLRFDDLTKNSLDLQRWLATVDSEIGTLPGSTKAIAFAAPRGDDSGLGTHYDPSDNLLIQLQGRKRLTWAPRTIEYPGMQWNPGFQANESQLLDFRNEGIPSPPKNLRSVLLKPGSVALLPAGCWHGTQAIDDSFSVSVSLDFPRAVDALLAALRRQLTTDPSWRKPLYGGWGRNGTHAKEDLEACLADLPGMLGELRASTILESVGPMSARSHFWNESTTFFRVPTMRAARARTAGRVTFTFSARLGRSSSTVECSATSARAVEWIVSRRGEFSFGELRRAAPSLTVELLRQIVSSLVDAALIQPVPSGGVRIRSRVGKKR